MKTILIVFTKEPVTGEVKTRLGKKIGMDASKWVYKQLLVSLPIAFKTIQPAYIILKPSLVFKTTESIKLRLDDSFLFIAC